MEGSAISWCRHTHNHWIGCCHASPACEHCYAEVETFARVKRHRGLELWGPPKTTARHLTAESNRRKPYAWDREAAASGVPATVFAASLSDVFEDHPDLPPWREELFAMMEATTSLRWLVLTKRAALVRRFAPPHWLRRWPRNVALGATVEDEKWGLPRVEALREVDAPMRFVSVEPQLAALPALARRLAGVAWLINGGERHTALGQARPFKLEWALDNLAACREAGAAYHFKQAGDAAEFEGRPFRTEARHGRDIREMPEPLRVQEFPVWCSSVSP